MLSFLDPAVLQVALFQLGKGGRSDAGNIFEAVSESAAVQRIEKIQGICVHKIVDKFL